MTQGIVRTEHVTIQLIDLDKDLKELALKANKKINFNLKQINKSVKLLPESADDPKIKGVSYLYYLKAINEIIHSNSKIIGFDYPLLGKDVSLLLFTDKKVYQPIAKYFLTLI